MKFRNPKTGDIFPEGTAEFCGRYYTQDCPSCPLYDYQDDAPFCEALVAADPYQAARRMGYEVIEDDAPTPECKPMESVNPQNPLPGMISEIISGDELLRQTAEEAAELAQAALKIIRVTRGTTPLDGESAVDMLVEEIADVQNCIAVLAERLTGLRDKADKISVEKMRRWRERLIASGGTT